MGDKRRLGQGIRWTIVLRRRSRQTAEAYEHDMKLWWPHDEILISSLMLYKDTGKEEYLDWFYTTLDYCKAHFADSEYGEWYGYLRRRRQAHRAAVQGFDL